MLGGIVNIKQKKVQYLRPNLFLMRYRFQIEMVEGKQKEHFGGDWLVTEFKFAHFLNIFHQFDLSP